VRVPHLRLTRLPRPALVALVAVVAVVLPALGLGSAYVYADDVPRGTTVLGIDIGGRSRAGAEVALTAGLARHSEPMAAPVRVRLGEAETEVQPEAVGLAVDVPATVAAAASTRRNPFTTLFGTRQVAPVVEVDAGRLDEALRETAEQVGAAMTMPEIRFDGLTPVPVYPEPGLGLDPRLSAAALTAYWPPVDRPADGWAPPTIVTIPLVEITPATTAAEVDRLVDEFARPAVAAPVTITTPGGGTLSAPPEVIARSLRLTSDSHGEIIPAVDGRALREGLAGALGGVETVPVNAHFVIEGGEPRVVDSAPGELVDTDRLAADLLAVLPAAPPRQIEATMRTSQATVTARHLDRLGVTEPVSTFTTYFDGGLGSPRSQNIIRVAEMVDGAVVEPGETFSLNGHTGDRSYAQGFQDAPVILDGRLQPGVGGGISQFTTTLFNAAYYAGLEDVEHWPHSYWYSRYPSVIEATIFYPTLDLKFRNDTPYGILIDTSYTSGSITVTMWGTKVWDEVGTEWGARRDVAEPQTRYVPPGPTCIATAGIQGFTQDAWRIFRRDGIEVQRELFTWRYGAQPEVICGAEPGGDG
jgi:vancomycin resistance protein YoaR